jgi:transcriptional regulator with XRE-family HTH domain
MELRIKEILKAKKMTAVSLAKDVNMAQPSMSNIVNGKVMPSIETLEKIAIALDVPFGELFDQPRADIINCPHCGGKIKVSKA